MEDEIPVMVFLVKQKYVCYKIKKMKSCVSGSAGIEYVCHKTKHVSDKAELCLLLDGIWSSVCVSCSVGIYFL